MTQTIPAAAIPAAALTQAAADIAATARHHLQPVPAILETAYAATLDDADPIHLARLKKLGHYPLTRLEAFLIELNGADYTRLETLDRFSAEGHALESKMAMRTRASMLAGYIVRSKPTFFE